MSDVKMHIPDSFFMRVETAAGGIDASDLAFAKAALRKLKPSALAPEMRPFRRAFLTALFEKRNSFADLLNAVKL
jgi:hypothetical protein